jgi:hypothetical protein
LEVGERVKSRTAVETPAEVADVANAIRALLETAGVGA